MEQFQQLSAAYVVWRVISSTLQYSKKAHTLKLRSGDANSRAERSAAHFPDKWLNCQGLSLHFRTWLPAGCDCDSPKGTAPTAVVFIAHGFGEHGGRYEHLARVLTTTLGVAVFCLDHQGHGASEGERAHVENFEDFSSDFLAHAQAMLRQRGRTWQEIPCFLLGHSMGGAIALQAALRAQATGEVTLAGVAVSGPLLALDPQAASPPLKAVARVLGRVLPKLGVTAIDSSLVSRDAAVVEAYDNDPLVYHGPTRAGLGLGILEVVEQLQSAAHLFELPLLLMHGSADKLCAPEGSDAFYRSASSADKTIKHYEGLFHEIFNEPEREQVIGDLAAWLRARLRSRL